MIIKQSPCYKCEKRHDLCHAKCKDYKDYTESLKEERKRQHLETVLSDYDYRAMRRRIKK